MTEIGIRREDKNRWERRAPLTPTHVNELVRERGHTIKVQPSPLRIFPDEAYLEAGAAVDEDLADCRVVLGVKEVPPELLLREKPYLFFSHVIKGQSYNMPLLRRLLDLDCTLIDYEAVVDRHGRRLIFFGRHAGYAGMVDALWALGQRTLSEGFESAFTAVRPAHAYRSVDDAADQLASVVGRRIRATGVMPRLHPLIVGFTGGGNVSQGAQEIFDRLPVVEVDPDDLPRLAGDAEPVAPGGLQGRLPPGAAYRFRPASAVPDDAGARDLLGPQGTPAGDDRGPQAAVGRARPAAACGSSPTSPVISAGSIEATVRSTEPDDPVFVYEPATGATLSGVAGDGPVILAVDNLPAEFPRDASEHFGDSLYPFLGPLASANFEAEFEHLTLPSSIMNAVVAHRGELAPKFRYLEDALTQAEA